MLQEIGGSGGPALPARRTLQHLVLCVEMLTPWFLP